MTRDSEVSPIQQVSVPLELWGGVGPGWLGSWELRQESLLGPQGLDGAGVLWQHLGTGRGSQPRGGQGLGGDDWAAYM
jgi:hypothetical protein